MAQERTRDKIWKYSLARAIKNEKAVKPEQMVEITGASERTVREALNVISQSGWLDREVMDDGTVRFVPPSEIVYKGPEL